MSLKIFSVAVAAIFSGGLSACGDARPWPETEWSVVTPPSQQVDVAPLDELHRKLAAGEHGYVDGMRVFRHGHLVYEQTYEHDFDAAAAGIDQPPGMYNYHDVDWHPTWQRGDLHTVQSVSKSVTSALVGIAIGRGELPGVDVPVMQYFAGYETGADTRWSAITLGDLLTMTAGIDWDESSTSYTDPSNDAAAMEGSEDWVQFVLHQPMATTPGEAFVYNSGITMLLAHILERETGKSVDAYAEEFLFGPLGIDRYYWKKTPTGLVDTEGGLYLHPHDLARFGYLYLNDGLWDGKRILPEGWVAASTRPAVEVPDWDGRYGYQWWLLPYEGKAKGWAYAALGYGGQHLLVVPEYDVVAVFTGWNIYDREPLKAEDALEYVLRALR